MTVLTMLKKPHLGATGLLLVGLLFIGVMLLANLLLRGARLDLTADKLYTISDGTERLVRNLKEPVNLYLFFSAESAAEIQPLRNHGVRVRELLEELVSRSDGKLTLKVIDPQPYTEEEDRATELGVSSTPIGALGQRLYLGLAGTNSTDGKESIPFLDPQAEEQLEYDVAKLIYNLSSSKKPVVGWLSSLPMQGDMDMQTGRPRPAWMVFQQVEQLYTVRSLEPSLTSIDTDIDVLVLVHPKNLAPAALYAIDQYALRGGRVLAFLDPDAQSDPGAGDPSNPMAQFAADKSSSLDPLLGAWGLEFKRDQVVADLERGLVVSMRAGAPPAQHIAVLGLDNTGMSKDVITTQLKSINLITAGSLKPVAGSTLQHETLLRTSTQAGLLPVQRVNMQSDPATLRDGFKPSGELALAVRVSGNAKSAYPEGPPAGVSAAADALKESAKPLNAVVIADTDLLLDYTWLQQQNFFGQVVLQPMADNGALVWNAVDNLGGSADLISIRGRAAYRRPFERVEQIRREAQAQSRVKEQQLQEQLRQTEDELNKLQTSQPGADVLSNEAAAAIERFQQEKLRIRKELRAIEANVDADIKSLGYLVKSVNLLLMPAIITGLGLLVALWRKRRRHAIAMLRRGSAA
jgi:ABC-type uncharacterized transport system involved in gliding motility auxiliary subunit